MALGVELYNYDRRRLVIDSRAVLRYLAVTTHLAYRLMFVQLTRYSFLTSEIFGDAAGLLVERMTTSLFRSPTSPAFGRRKSTLIKKEHNRENRLIEREKGG